MFGLNGKDPVVGKANIVIKRPVHLVFDFIGVDFFKNYPRWSPEVIKLEPLSHEPLKLGSLVRQVRIDHGHRSESVFKVTAFETNKRLCFEGTTNPYLCDYVFEAFPNTTATGITFTFQLLSIDLYMRPFDKLIKIAIQDGAERTVRNLRNLIEKEIPPMVNAK